MRSLRRRQRRKAFNDRALDGFVVAGVVLFVVGLFAAGYRLKDGGFSAEYVSASPLPAVVVPNGGVTPGGAQVVDTRSPIDIAVDNALSPISVVPGGRRAAGASSLLLDTPSTTGGAAPGSTSTSGPGSTTTTVTDPPTTTTVTDPPPPPPDGDGEGPPRNR